jgi:hypothetical protein
VSDHDSGCAGFEDVVILMAGALTLLARAPVGGGYWLHIFPALAITGLGAGLCFPPLMGLAMSGATAQDAGLASGLINTTGQVGGALALAMLATITSARAGHLSATGQSSAAALTGGYHLGFWISAALVLAGAGGALTALKPQTPQRPQPQANSSTSTAPLKASSPDG